MTLNLAPTLTPGAWWVLLLLAASPCYSTSTFTVYWNSPTQKCHQFGVNINASAFGIVQNTDDLFYGDKVSMFYSPGAFPWLNGSVPVNGGIPQNGSLTTHAQAFINRITQQLPLNYSGVAVLDFESYYPYLGMSQKQYRQASYRWVAAAHPHWSHDQVEKASQLSFDLNAKEFFQLLLWLGRELRPHALWGYYHYPYCHNYGPGVGECKPQVIEYNNEMLWLFQMSRALYPSIYIFKDSGWDPRTRRLNTRGRLLEALRIRQRTGKTMPILPYFWYRYHDSASFLSPLDVVNNLGFAKLLGLEGAVVWGSGLDVTSKSQCQDLQRYVDQKLGPLVQYLDQLPRFVLRSVINSRRLLKRLVRKVKKGKRSHSFSRV